MPTRPSQGGSNGTWGTELDAWLDVAHNADGTLLSSAVQTALGGSVTALSVVSVKDRGATGNGSTDDTASFTTASTAAGNGGTVVVPPGTYVVGGLVVSATNQTWILAQGATLLLPPASATSRIMRFNGTGCKLTGGVLDGNLANQTAPALSGLIRIAANGCVVDGVTFQSAYSYGCEVFGIRENVTVKNCVATGCLNAAFVADVSGNTGTLRGIGFLNNIVRQEAVAVATQTGGGFLVKGDPANLAEGIRIEGNYYYGISDVTISNQVIAIGVAYATRPVVSGNVTYGSYTGVSISFKSVGASVVGNTTFGCPYFGIELTSSPDAALTGGSGHTATGNVVYCNSVGDGIIIDSVSRSTIAGNIINSPKNYGIRVFVSSTGDTSSDNTIGGNDVFAPGNVAGIQICANRATATVDRNAVTGNNVRGDSTAGGRGIQLLNNVGGGTVDGSLVADNKISAFATRVSQTSDTNTSFGRALIDILIRGMGFVSWNAHPSQPSSANSTLTSQTVYLVAVPYKEGDVVANVCWEIGVAAVGTTPTNIFVGIADSTGKMLAQSADLKASAIWTSTGLAAAPLSASYTILADGVYYHVILINGSFGTTQPGFARGQGTIVANGSNRLGATGVTTGQTALPANGSSIAGGLTATNALNIYAYST